MTTVNNVGGTQQQSFSDPVKKILGKDDFLKLMITQLKYQDPLEPTDNKEFIAQMAQFSSLEQMTNMSEGFKNLASMQESILRESAVAQAINIIGHSVTAVLPDGNNLTGMATGMKIIDGIPNVIVNGREIPFSYVEQVNRVEQVNPGNEETSQQGGAV